MGAREQLRFDRAKLSRATALAGLLRGELRQSAGLSTSPISDAFAGRPVGVRVARAIAKALNCTIAELAAEGGRVRESAVSDS